VEHFLIRFGPFAVALGAATEGDITMLLAGVMVHRGLLSPAVVLAAGCLGALASDCVFFALARRGATVLRTNAVYRRVGPFVERLAGRFGAGQILVSRLAYGIRIASMVFWGIHGLSWTTFVLLDLISCVVWASIMFAIGFTVSGSVATVLGTVKTAELWLLGIVVVVLGLVLGLRAVTRRELRRDRR
jgi:membrane protein DedA with SNARE-associated domain